ncbi:MAG TPA: hypothetical protein VGX68_18195 [Thermoanaerobaculia bacterium]|nr:hypothetical protein [Thermoanaerobaculia bacterium]
MLLSILFLLLAGSAGAATVPGHPWCGTQRSGLAVELAAHRDHQRRLDRQRAEEKALRTFPEAVKVGDVAVLVDDGSIIVQPNQLDLDELGVQYVPQKKGGYVVSPSADGVSAELGDKIPLGDDDSRLVQFPKGFKFRFYNKVYTKMFVHSDGNLTFNAADAASTERSLFRLLGGPPRVAPLFADLNPEAASGEGGVYVLTSKTKIVVSWLDVPTFGTNNRNTFQVVLNADGRIAFAFGRLDSLVGVVGLAPGGGGQVQLLDYTANLPTGAIKTAVAERFATERAVDNLAIAQAFFREFADDYDHLVVFLDFPQSLGSAFAFEITVKNEIKGIGVEVYDASVAAGSKGRLRSFVQMGTLARYPDDPETVFLGTNNTLALLGQETGHRWLAFLHFLDDNGQPNDALLGRDLAHWSFCHNTLASDMEGNEIREEGGDHFMTIAATQRYSPLDQYAMGLIPASDVPPFYYIDGCNANRAAAPEIGHLLQGRRADVTIDRIIAAEGQRVPAANKAPHTFNMAFVLVAPADPGPSADGIAKVDRIRAAWEPYFAQATDGNGTVSTALKTRRRR